MLELDIRNKVGYRAAPRQQIDCAELAKSGGRDSTHSYERKESVKKYGWSLI